MDHVTELSTDLRRALDELHAEAMRRNVRELMAPLAWLDEAERWLAYELDRLQTGAAREAVSFTYIPAELRK